MTDIGFTVTIDFIKMVKEEITVKPNFIKEKELVSRKILSVPFVDNYEVEKTTGEGFISRVELEDGQVFHMDIHVLKDAFPVKIKELINNAEKKVRTDYLVVVAPFISEKSFLLCESGEVGFIDHAGNCLFKYHSIYISVSGNKNPESSKRALKSIFEKSSTVSSLILRTMLEDAGKSWRLKNLSGKVGCSIGQVSKVKDFLANNAWIEVGNEGVKITDIESLMKEWARVYSGKKEEAYECYSLDNIAEIEEKLERMKEECGIAYYLTGFTGGVRYAPVVRYNKIHVYIKPEDIKEAMDYLGCKIVESGANLSIIEPYDECVLKDSRIMKGSHVVSPVQIYLDCMGLKGRGEELANAILIKEIIKTDVT